MAEPDFTHIDGSETHQRVRFTSGTRLYEEALRDSRWGGRYWSPIG